MKKQLIITIILLIAIAFTTVIYFSKLSPPGMRTEQIINAIPNNAALIFEFNNDKGFYDIYKNNLLFAAITGKDRLEELSILRHELLQNPLLSQFFNYNNIFISVHPSAANTFDFLFTTTLSKGVNSSTFDELLKQAGNGLIVTPFIIGKEQGFIIYISALKKRFYALSKANNILTGSFSMALISQCVVPKTDQPSYVLLSDQQNANSLASLYVNYGRFSALFARMFKNQNSEIVKGYGQFTGYAALNLNYHSDAVMFNGTTYIQHGKPSYFGLFAGQHPVTNHLKDIFPSTTAYSSNFSISDVKKFATRLYDYQDKEGLKNESTNVFKQIKNETGVTLNTSFHDLLGTEFAMVTTRYFERFAIISVLDGSRLKTLLKAVSTMSTENMGKLNYDLLPYYLLGDSFSVFKRPYFMIIDNYLVLANSMVELNSYYDTYINRKFLSKNDRYNRFDNLLAGRSNVALFVNFKNAFQIFQNDLNTGVLDNFEENKTNWGAFYGASWQLTASDKDFYTNFCLKLNTDTTTAAFK